MADSWSHETRERFFYGSLALSTLAVVWLFLPFLDVIVFAGVVATVSSPVHERLTAWLRGRRLLAAVVTTLLLALAVFLPIGLLLYRTALDGLQFASTAMDGLADPERYNQLGHVRDTWMRPALEALQPVLGSDVDPVEHVTAQARDAAAALLQGATGLVPGLLGSVTALFIDAMLFVFTVVVLLAEGERLLQFVLDLSPLQDRYARRLLDVFREFATHMVVGGFATASAMGAIGMLGYWLFGVPRPLFFGVLTAVGSFAPVVGTASVVFPLVVWVGLTHGWGWAVGLTLWSVVFTGTADNVLRPVFMRGNSDIHPLLVFFAVFGGMSWLGLTGVLVGPVLVAFFLALARIRREDLAAAEAHLPLP